MAVVILRSFFILVLVFLTHACSMATAVLLDLSMAPIMVVPVILVYAVFFQGLVEGAITALLIGALVDGGPLATASCWLIFSVCSTYVGRPQWSIVFTGVFFGSAFYRVLIYCFSLFVLGGHANWDWGYFIFGPIIDVGAAYLVLKPLHWLNHRFKLVDEVADTLSRPQWV